MLILNLPGFTLQPHNKNYFAPHLQVPYNQRLESWCSASNKVLFVSNSGLFTVLFLRQLKDCLNSKGERLVFVLNNLLNDCECSKPNS